jgi:predicted transcriptional regulator of viral defense system
MSLLTHYIEGLQKRGKLSFTTTQLQEDLHISPATAWNMISRLKKTGAIISPAKGLYIIVPVEQRPYGSIPAQDLIPILMKHLQANYYVACLSAGLYHGATHQKPGSFQIITNRRMQKTLHFGQVRIECLYKQEIKGLPTQDFAVNTGYLKISTPELTALDLFLYPEKCGGLNHIATVLSELIEAIDEDRLLTLADDYKKTFWLQRMGYILDSIEPDDEDKAIKIIKRLAVYLATRNIRYTPLAPELSSGGFSRNQKWKIIENTNVEADT